jgi:hypothetical protein
VTSAIAAEPARRRAFAATDFRAPGVGGAAWQLAAHGAGGPGASKADAQTRPATGTRLAVGAVAARLTVSAVAGRWVASAVFSPPVPAQWVTP